VPLLSKANRNIGRINSLIISFTQHNIIIRMKQRITRYVYIYFCIYRIKNTCPNLTFSDKFTTIVYIKIRS